MYLYTCMTWTRRSFQLQWIKARTIISTTTTDFTFKQHGQALSLSLTVMTFSLLAVVFSLVLPWSLRSAPLISARISTHYLHYKLSIHTPALFKNIYIFMTSPSILLIKWNSATVVAVPEWFCFGKKGIDFIWWLAYYFQQEIRIFS